MDPAVGPQQHYNLKWNNHTNNFLQVFAEHQNQEALVDVTLTCEGHYISAHRLVLSACSDYFRTIFRIQQNVPHPFVMLNGIKFKDLKYILNFMYLGEVKVLESDLPSVLALGESLQVKGLSSVRLVDNNESKTPENKHNNSVPVCVNTHTENIKNGEHFSLHAALTKPPSVVNVVTPLTTPHGSIVPNTQRTKIPFVSKENTENEQVPFKKILLNKPKGGIVPLGTNSIPANGLENTEPVTKPIKSSAVPSSSADSSTQEPGPPPPNAFMMFITEWKDKLMAENPGQDSKSVTVLLGNKWKSLDAATKQVYIDAALKAEKEYRKEYPNYYSSRKRKIPPTNSNSNSNDGFTNKEGDVEPVISISD